MVTDLLLQATQREPYKALVCQGLLIIEIVICIHYLIGPSPHAVRPATLFFCMSVNMCVFNVKSHKECHKDKKGINRAVTGFVSVPVSLISCEMA